jgi:tetratricopeptide (TPR) repeat protein
MLPLYDADRLDASAADVLSGASRSAPPVLLPRMFRRTDDFCWQGIVHETPVEWMTAPGRVFEEVNAAIIHLGNVETYRAAKGKGLRNLLLLEQQCEQEPDNPTARGYLASELVNAGDLQRATTEVERAWHSLVEVLDRPREGAGPAGVQIASLRASLAMRSGDYKKAIATADGWDRIGTKHPNLVTLRAMSLRRQTQTLPLKERLPLLEMVIAGLEWSRSVEDQNFAEWLIPVARKYNVTVELGIALLLSSRPDEALAAFQQALVLEPQMRGPKIGVVEALFDAGRTEESLAALQPMLADGGADDWALASCICLTIGANEDAQAFFQTALQHGIPGSKVSYRKERFAELAAVFEPEP